VKVWKDKLFCQKYLNQNEKKKIMWSKIIVRRLLFENNYARKFKDKARRSCATYESLSVQKNEVLCQEYLNQNERKKIIWLEIIV